MLLVEYELGYPAAIEVVGVSGADRFMDHADTLQGFKAADGSRVKLRWPRLSCYRLGSRVRIYGEGLSGEIDYSQLLAEVPMWSSYAEKWGWSLNAFGQGDFGYSGTGAVGWGLGVFRQGEFGFDVEFIEFVSDVLSAGLHRFALKVCEGAGNEEEGPGHVCQVYVDPIPESPRLQIDSYNPNEDRLVLAMG
jgi:hypothetical protein